MKAMPAAKRVATRTLSQPAYEAASEPRAGPTDAATDKTAVAVVVFNYHIITTKILSEYRNLLLFNIMDFTVAILEFKKINKFLTSSCDSPLLKHLKIQ